MQQHAVTCTMVAIDINEAVLDRGDWIADVTSEKVPELYRLPALPGGDAEAEFPTFKNIAPALGMSGSVVVDDFTGGGKLEIITSSWDYRHRRWSGG